MASIDRREKGYNERDLKIAIGLGAGMTGEEVARFAGIDRSTVYARKATNVEFIEFVSSLVRAATAASIAASAESIKARYETMYDKAVRNLSTFLDSGDDRLKFAATTRVIDQIEGKPTQRIETKNETKVIEEHVVSLPAELLSYLTGVVADTRRVLTGDVYDAEIVSESAGGGVTAPLLPAADGELRAEGLGVSAAEAAPTH